MKKIGKLILVAIITLLVVKVTTFGWRPSGPAVFIPEKKLLPLAENLKGHVTVLSHEIGDRSVYRYDQLDKAERYITVRLMSYGYTVEFQKYTVSGREFKNIVATKQGTAYPYEYVLVGAHYDTCFNVGADDNASGVAGLLELARAFSKQEVKRSIKFVAFVNEEPPFFKTGAMGSMVYARAARAKDEDIIAVLILESVGYYSHKPYSQRYPPLLGLFLPNKGDFIGLVGNFPSQWLLTSVASNFRIHSSLPMEALTLPAFIPAVTFSDHYSFWKEGYPAVMITDTAFYRNPNYHKDSDSYETLDYQAMAELVNGLKGVLEELTQ